MKKLKITLIPRAAEVWCAGLWYCGLPGFPGAAVGRTPKEVFELWKHNYPEQYAALCAAAGVQA